MISGKTKSGFEYEIDETVMDDMRFLEIAAKADDDIFSYLKFVEGLLGADQKEKLYKHLEDNYGRASMEKFQIEMTDIFENGNVDTKNS